MQETAATVPSTNLEERFQPHHTLPTSARFSVVFQSLRTWQSTPLTLLPESFHVAPFCLILTQGHRLKDGPASYPLNLSCLMPISSKVPRLGSPWFASVLSQWPGCLLVSTLAPGWTVSASLGAVLLFLEISPAAFLLRLYAVQGHFP